MVDTYASISDSFKREMLKDQASRCTSQVIEYMNKKLLLRKWKYRHYSLGSTHTLVSVSESHQQTCTVAYQPSFDTDDAAQALYNYQ